MAWISVGHCERNDESGAEERQLDEHRDRDEPAAVLCDARGETSTRERADQKCGDRDERRRNRKLGCTGNCETEKYDVAGHIRHEHMTEREIADRVHQPRHDRENEE